MKQKIFKSVLSLCLAASSLVSADQYSWCDWEKYNFYLGGNLGVSTLNAHRNDLDGFLTDNSGWSQNDTGFAGGVRMGIDWQKCNLVFGLLADWNGMNLKTELSNDPNGSGNNSGITSKVNWMTTIQGRAGLTDGNTLFYIIAGAACAKFKTHWRDGSPTVHFNNNHTQWGWTGGIGLETKLCDNFSVGFEMALAHFDEKKSTFNDPVTPTTRYAFGESSSLYSGRIYINYNFGRCLSYFCQ